MRKEVRFSYERASAKLVVWGEGLATLSNVFSIKRGVGHASEVMRQVAEYADDNYLTITLEAMRYGYADKKSPDNEGLKRFYKRFGFVDCGRNMMQRAPGSQEIHAS